MYIVPDEILESMNCSTCQKSLTVMPVIMYDDGRRTCGRCWDPDAKADEPQGVPVPNPMVEHGLFKCLNRFDGCRRLLSYTQVADHEAYCYSRAHICPLCPDTNYVPSYYMIRHFEAHHDNNYLRTNSFRAEQVPDWVVFYLYRSKDNLFFIEFRTIDETMFCVCAYYLGECHDADKITQTFTVGYGDKPTKYNSVTRPVTATSSTVPSEGFIFRMPDARTKFVFVEFHLDAVNLEVDLVTGGSVNQNIGLMRKLKLHHVNKPGVTLSADSSSIQTEDSKFVMFCACCSLPEYDRVAFVEVRPRVYQVLCRSCKLYFRRKSPEMRLIPEWEVFPSALNIREHLEYSCVWRYRGCEEFCGAKDLREHEYLCRLHPAENCPVEGCFYGGTPPELEQHLVMVHPSDTICMGPVVNIPFGNCSPFYRNYFFIWTHYGFVSVNITGEDSEFKISFAWQKESACRTWMRVLVHDDKYQVMHLVTNSFPVGVPPESYITVRCFFEFKNHRELHGMPISF